MDWIGLAHDRDRRRTLVSALMNLQVPWNAGNFLTSCLSIRTLHNGVSKYDVYCKGWDLIPNCTLNMVPKKKKRPHDGLQHTGTSSLTEMHCAVVHDYTIWNKYLINKHNRDESPYEINLFTSFFFYFHYSKSEQEETVPWKHQEPSPNDTVISRRPKPLATVFLIHNSSVCFNKKIPPFHAIMFHRYKNWCINETPTCSHWYSTHIWWRCSCEPPL